MAVVLNSEENAYFSSTSLRRSHSQPKFIAHKSYVKAPLRKASVSTIRPPPSPSQSTSSSSSSSPRTHPIDSRTSSYASTPASSLSLDARCEEENADDQINFPSYDDVGFYGHIEDREPPTSPPSDHAYTVSSTSNSTSTNISIPTSPKALEHAEDDNSLQVQPTRHVDYLSHNWREEEIWASWRHIVSKRGFYNNSARLENASWRSWAKSKNRLKTVSPEKLNWLKDCDVTWLYGPLQSSSDKHLRLSPSPENGDGALSTSSSFSSKKPILKKRSMSELMLQRSLSSSSLLKQAAAAVQAQQTGDRIIARPSVSRSSSNYLDFPYTSRRPSHDNSTRLSSLASSGGASPGSGDKRHIHFNESVEQCIAVEMKGEDETETEPYHALDYGDSDSDEDAIMMKRSNSAKKLPPLSGKKTAKPNATSDNKIIAKLPSTTLKYREDEPHDTAMKHSGGSWSGRLLSPSPSQETLKPSKPSTRLLLGDDDEEDADVDWQPPAHHALRSDVLSHDVRVDFQHSPVEGPDGPAGMRRTSSGMFMPYDEDEDDIVSEGLFGRVVDTVNTAKDIAHVIWNVGWRR